MHSVTSADGTVIAYEQQGAGPALIIVDGALSTRGGKAELRGLLAPRGPLECLIPSPYPSPAEWFDGKFYGWAQGQACFLALLPRKFAQPSRRTRPAPRSPRGRLASRNCSHIQTRVLSVTPQ